MPLISLGLISWHLNCISLGMTTKHETLENKMSDERIERFKKINVGGSNYCILVPSELYDSLDLDKIYCDPKIKDGHVLVSEYWDWSNVRRSLRIQKNIVAKILKERA